MKECQSRSDGFSFDGIYEQSKSRPESIRVANVKYHWQKCKMHATPASGKAFN
jgi:hypothetical protein